MPGAPLRRVALALGALAVAAALAGLPCANAQDAQVSIDVPQGKVKTIRLRNLPLGTALAVAVSASSRLGVALVAQAALRDRQPRALFSGTLERRLSFKVVIPQTSDYYLLLDNRGGGVDVTASAAIRAERGRPKPPARDPAGPGKDQRATAAPSYDFAGFLPTSSRPIRS